MRTTLLAAVAAIGLGFSGSTLVSAAPAYGPGLSTAADALDMTQNVWWRNRYHYRYYRGGSWCWRHPRRC